ncbi:MAG: cation:proton antiporter [Thiohalocapsa sp.]
MRSGIGQRMNGRSCALLGAALVMLLALPMPAFAAESGHGSDAVFLWEIVLLLVAGRLLGEAMQRLGQPAVMGQLLAGVLLGPSVLGAALPQVQQALFPGTPAQSAMIGAVAQLGILMLLLLTGMETDLSLVRRTGKTAVSTSLAGIAVPFMLGFGLGELLPASMLPNPQQRLITALFLGTALSISSVKIVAMTIRDLGFMRRMLGQITVAAAIIDDTIGWIILSVILGIAERGHFELTGFAQSVVGTLLFLALSFTLGRRLVFLLIRWVNDNFVVDLPVITAILVVMGLMALITQAIGVHTVLGAFVAGMLVGQSPILTRHIENQLRGLIVALFMPVFFGIAGLEARLDALAQPKYLLLSLALIVIASVGKFTGAFLGGRFGGLTWRESAALGCGMNARGSTEVIVATIGLATGALSQNLYTMILTMAVVTTMAMPPMLRWALARVPLGPEEQVRLEREEFEAKGFVTNIERLLVAVDDSASGQFASRLSGRLAGSLRIPTTIVSLTAEPRSPQRVAVPGAPARAERLAKALAEDAKPDVAEETKPPAPVDITTREKATPADEAVAEEARKGYDFLVVGVEPTAARDGFDAQVARVVAGFDGPYGIVAARGAFRRPHFRQALDILVPVTGTAYSRRGAEVALALARADYGSVTALYVAPPEAAPWHSPLRYPFAIGTGGNAILREIVEIGDKMGVPVRTMVRSDASAAEAIATHFELGNHNLLVMGVSPRPGETLFFGAVPAALLERCQRSILFVSS